MFDNENGDNIFTMDELDQLFAEDTQETPPETQKDGQSENTNDTSTDSVDTTKAFAKRLKESTDKARKEERDTIAKSLGYTSYDDMQKSREKKMLEDEGLDSDTVSPIVEKLVKQRLENDPRMQELEEWRKSKVQEFGKRELAEITKLTDGEITTLSQLPKEVIDLWKQKGSLKNAFLEIKGEEYINKYKGEHSKTTTSHLATPSGNAPQSTGKRPYTEEEKRMYRFFNPSVSDEELNKKQKDV